MPTSSPAKTARTRFREGDFRFPLPLHCPCCAAPLETERLTSHRQLGQFGILTCDCSRYPVVADIPILLNGPITGAQVGTRRVCRLIESDSLSAAIVEASYPGMRIFDQQSVLSRLLPTGWTSRRTRRGRRLHLDTWSRAFERLINDPAQMMTESLFDLYFGTRGIGDLDTRDYFTFRWTQPRHLVPLALLGASDLGTRPSLDVGCGAGHVTRFMVNKAPGQVVVGLDSHFFLLFIARHCVAPSASFICGDWEEGLPFDDSAFGTAVSVNAFHFLRQKTHAASEIKRVLDDNGQLVLTALRQRLMAHSTKNLALSPAGYARLFSDMNTLMFDDDLILQAYLSGHAPAATEAAAAEDLEAVPLVSLVATRGPLPPLRKQPLAPMPHAIGRLDVNPLYREIARHPDGSRVLRRHFPSNHYSSENKEMHEYLPSEVRLTPDVAGALDAGRVTPEMEPLIRSCVLTDIPAGYRAIPAAGRR